MRVTAGSGEVSGESNRVVLSGEDLSGISYSIVADSSPDASGDVRPGVFFGAI